MASDCEYMKQTAIPRMITVLICCQVFNVNIAGLVPVHQKDNILHCFGLATHCCSKVLIYFRSKVAVMYTKSTKAVQVPMITAS